MKIEDMRDVIMLQFLSQVDHMQSQCYQIAILKWILEQLMEVAMQ